MVLLLLLNGQSASLRLGMKGMSEYVLHSQIEGNRFRFELSNNFLMCRVETEKAKHSLSFFAYYTSII